MTSFSRTVKAMPSAAVSVENRKWPPRVTPVLVHAGIALDQSRRGAAHVGEAFGGPRQHQHREPVPDTDSLVVRVLSVEQLAVPGGGPGHGEARAAATARVDDALRHLLLDA